MSFGAYLSLQTLFQYAEIAIVVFFTLMTSRYLLGENIEPDSKLYRISFVSMFWIVTLPFSIIIVFFKRHIELRRLRKNAK